MNVMIIIVIISCAAMEGVSLHYWLQASIYDYDNYHDPFTRKGYTFSRYFGLYNDILTFSASIVISVFGRRFNCFDSEV